MDFISLAERTTVKAIARHLVEDDDFEHLDTTHTSNHAESSQYINDSILDVTQRSSEFDSFTDQDLQNSPILSKVTEAELFFLATNFLLCKYLEYFPMSSSTCFDIVCSRHHFSYISFVFHSSRCCHGFDYYYGL
jgi:hypothetical protein